METDEYQLMFQIEESHWWYQALRRLLFFELERALPDWSHKPLLDAGCGTGAILKRLSNQERNRGIDLSPAALKFCRQRGLENVIQGDIAAMPFSDDSFDGIVCSSVLYHRWVADVDAALGELNRVLCPGGCLLVNLPAYDFLYSAHDAATFTARRFTKGQIAASLLRSGFRLERLTYWTTLLFPVAWAARRLNLAKEGRDFGKNRTCSPRWNRTMNVLMNLEFQILRRRSLPFGVALFCVARKSK